MYQKYLLFPNTKKKTEILSSLIHQTLIAGHLGWFKESTEGGKWCTIKVEDLSKALLAAIGEKVRRGKLDLDGLMEYIE